MIDFFLSHTHTHTHTERETHTHTHTHTSLFELDECLETCHISPQNLKKKVMHERNYIVHDKQETVLFCNIIIKHMSPPVLITVMHPDILICSLL